MNETPLTPWFIAKEDGFVECGHCDCMAGLGEVCCHVSALLFWVETTYRANANLTVTQKKAYWPVPSYVDKVAYEEIKNIDFSSAEKRVKDFNSTLSGLEQMGKQTIKLPDVPEPTEEEKKFFAQSLLNSQCMPAYLSVKKDFQEAYIPDILQEGKLPVCLGKLREEKFLNMDREELISVCGKLADGIKVTEEQAKNAELITKKQSMCKEWHALRHGRITASNVKLVCQGSVKKPAMSSVKAICGTGSRFKGKATEWGKVHEGDALLKYKRKQEWLHENFCMDDAGLFISTDHPYLGASPDGLVSCTCCGDGLVEVKCPYSAKDTDVDKVEFFGEDGTLKSAHRYMYQVQTQLLVSKREYCDFVVWTEKECKWQRIMPIPSMQEEIITKTQEYFRSVILPEVTGNLISRESTAAKVLTASAYIQPHSVSSNNAEIICICRQPYNECDDVIGCDSENCPYVWLHFKCIKLKKVPKGAFYCEQCRQDKQKKQKKK